MCMPMCAHVCDYVRASVSGPLRPLLSYGFYPLKSSFIHSYLIYAAIFEILAQKRFIGLVGEMIFKGHEVIFAVLDVLLGF